jgi:hypothetical protein
MNENFDLPQFPTQEINLTEIVDSGTELYAQLESGVTGMPAHRVGTELLDSNPNLNPLMSGRATLEEPGVGSRAIDPIVRPFVPISRPFERHNTTNGIGLTYPADNFLLTLSNNTLGAEGSADVLCAVIEVARTVDAEYMPQALAGTDELGDAGRTTVQGLVKVHPDNTVERYIAEYHNGSDEHGNIFTSLHFRPAVYP